MVVRLSRADPRSGMPFRPLMPAPHLAAPDLPLPRAAAGPPPGVGVGCDTGVMAYDEELADRLRAALGDQPELTEKRMFGGLGFMVEGHMAVAASGQGGLMVRVDPADSEELVDHVLVDRVVMRGRAMDGWLRVAPEAVESDEALQGWVRRGVAAARSLPPR